MKMTRWTPPARPAGAARALLLTPILAALLGGCMMQEEPYKPLLHGKTIVETYPPPVDPALRPRRYIAPPADPVVIENGPKATLIYTCRYARCETLKEAIDNFVSPEGTVQASPALNVLLVSDAREFVPGLLKMAEELDRPTPQLLVEAKIVEITIDSDLEYEMKDWFTQLPAGFKDFVQSSGIQLGPPGAAPNPTQGGQVTIRPLANDKEFLDLFIRLLVTRGNAKILSSPNLIVGAGTEASIITGQEVPIQTATVISGSVNTTTQFKRVGIKLRVTPLQIAGDTAKVDVYPEVSTVLKTVSGGQGIENPVIAVRNVRSVLSMKDGQILTVGGLLSSEDHKVVKKVPGLGDLPGVGVLFQSIRVTTTQTQLIFFLRVSILPEFEAYGLDLHRPGAGMEELENLPTTRPLTQPASGPAPWPKPVPRYIDVTPASAPAGWSPPLGRIRTPQTQPAGPPAGDPPPNGLRSKPKVVDDTPPPKVIDETPSPKVIDDP